MADRGKIDRKECVSYKERLKQIRPEETLKEKIEREGIDVVPEDPFAGLVLNVGRKYMNWRYGKPDASINKEIAVLFVLILLCFAQFIYTVGILKAQVTMEWLYASIGFMIIGAVLMGIFFVIFQRRCPNPKCKEYFGIEAIDSKKVDEKEVYRTETEIKMEKIYRNTYRCAFCGHTFTRNESEYEVVPIN